jgi:predicted alpha/beta hydrolase family esterase
MANSLSPSVLTIPGLWNSGPLHWQTHWEARHPSFRRVQQGDFDHPARDEWVATLDAAVRACFNPPILAAHSLGCSLVAQWAIDCGDRGVRGAFLVAPSDVEAPDYPIEGRSFAKMPLAKLPFPSIVVASTNDEYVSNERARLFADAWGSRPSSSAMPATSTARQASVPGRMGSGCCSTSAKSAERSGASDIGSGHSVIGTFDSDIGTIASVIGTIASAIGTIASVIGTIGSVIGTIASAIGTIGSVIGTVASDIGTIASVIGTVGSVIGTVASVIGTVASAIGTVASAIGTVASAIGTIASVIGTAGSVIETIASDIGTVASVIGTADSDLLPPFPVFWRVFPRLSNLFFAGASQFLSDPFQTAPSAFSPAA